jgi:hypothetical protein
MLKSSPSTQPITKLPMSKKTFPVSKAPSAFALSIPKRAEKPQRKTESPSASFRDFLYFSGKPT